MSEMAARVIFGFLLCAVGVVWLGQGTGLIKGSFMTGEALWAVIGGVLLVLGLALLGAAWRLRGRA
jgi:hypothetical protein